MDERIVYILIENVRYINENNIRCREKEPSRRRNNTDVAPDEWKKHIIKSIKKAMLLKFYKGINLIMHII